MATRMISLTGLENTMETIDWSTVEQKLFTAGQETIARFAQEHPNVTCSFFACAADPLSGDFAFCFDVPENAAYEAIQQEIQVSHHRKSLGTKPWKTEAWRKAHASLNQPLCDYASEISLFQYALYTRLSFDWRAFAVHRNFPQSREGEDNYLEGQTLLVIWSVLEQLIANRTFAQLRMTSPFRVGYQFPEKPLVILRFLNWPAPGGQTIYSAQDLPKKKGRR